MITVGVVNGVSISVPYVAGMNAQQALEEAYSSVWPSPFNFAVQYYGYDHLAPYDYMGYMVTMINGQYDTPDNQMYWEFLVDLKVSSLSVYQDLY